MQVFVYGTLKSGCCNHHYLTGQTLLGEAWTEPRFALFDLGGYPGMVETSVAPEAVAGEVWEIDTACLAQLDELEAIDQGEYHRVILPLQGEWSAVWGYLYSWPLGDAPRVASSWEE